MQFRVNKTLLIVIYSCDGKGEFSVSLIQYVVSYDFSETF